MFTANIATRLFFIITAAISLSATAAEPTSGTATAAPFLPSAVADKSAPTVQRAGVKIPLRPEMLKFDEPKLTVPKVQETTMTNGMRFYFYESRDLPATYFTMIINAGERLDPADKVGVGEITARGIRSGGTTEKSADEIDRELEQLGSSLSIEAERDRVVIDLFALSENREKALSILADLLLKPAFDEKKLQQQKDLVAEDIRRENDEPAEISRREFRKVIYGASSPLARTPTTANIRALTRDDVVKFYENFYRPSSVSFGIAGDVTLDEARKLAEQAFGAWSKPPAEVPPLPAVTERATTGPTVFHVEKDTAQAQIRVGHLGVPRHIPEQYAISVLNGVYGMSGFSSRLTQRVRTQRGYAYSVGGGIFSDEPQGLFVAVAGSKTATTAAAIDEILSVTQELISGDIKPVELELAKRDAIYTFVNQFDVPRSVLYNHMYYDYQGYPDEYLDTFVQSVQAVTAQQVEQAARKFIKPSNLVVLVVGPGQKLDRPLMSFGTTEEIKLPDVPEESLETKNPDPMPPSPSPPIGQEH